MEVPDVLASAWSADGSSAEGSSRSGALRTSSSPGPLSRAALGGGRTWGSGGWPKRWIMTGGGGAGGGVATPRTLSKPEALRTMVVTPGDGASWVYHVQASGGIVFDSNPSDEWQETVNKAAGLARAIELAERAFGAAPA